MMSKTRSRLDYKRPMWLSLIFFVCGIIFIVCLPSFYFIWDFGSHGGRFVTHTAPFAVVVTWLFAVVAFITSFFPLKRKSLNHFIGYILLATALTPIALIFGQFGYVLFFDTWFSLSNLVFSAISGVFLATPSFFLFLQAKYVNEKRGRSSINRPAAVLFSLGLYVVLGLLQMMDTSFISMNRDRLNSLKEPEMMLAVKAIAGYPFCLGRCQRMVCRLPWPSPKNFDHQDQLYLDKKYKAENKYFELIGDKTNPNYRCPDT